MMNFSEAISKIQKALAEVGSNISPNDFDGIIVKRLESSNTLDDGRSTNQTHIAITGDQMDMFPYVRADGYFEVPYEKEDDDLKKYYIAQIPVILHKENVEYLDKDKELFTDDEHVVHVSIVRSRRKDGGDQLQMSMTNIDSPEFVKYRKLVHTKYFMILLKRKKQLLYDMYCMKNDDQTIGEISDLNNCFYKLSTNTAVRLDELAIDADSNKKDKYRHLLPATVKDCAKAIIDYFYQYDGLKNLENYMESSDATIKINTDLIKDSDVKGNYLPQLFAKESSKMFDDDKRTFLDEEYFINGDKCRLSNQWDNTPLTTAPAGHNNLNALIVVINISYNQIASVVDMGGRKYIQTSALPFKTVSLSSMAREAAQQIVNEIYKVDAFDRIKDFFVINEKIIKLDTSSMDGEVSRGNYLRFIFARPGSEMYEPDGSGNSRVFTTPNYDFNIGDQHITCRLTTQWQDVDLNPENSGNFLKALILVINKYYRGLVEIKDLNGKRYMYVYRAYFILNELPETFQNKFARRYISSLVAKPFVILTGNSGTGKTRISKQFSEYLEEFTSENEKNWVLVPVGADWTDNTKILGFYNPLGDDGKGKYEETEILKLIKRANLPENQDKPFFIILDEMNLSHVERYFADFLSHMETPDLPFILDGYKDSDGNDVQIEYPSNLFIVGTVNIDETTYMFSPKVLDRANVIEFKPEADSVLDLFIQSGNIENVSPADDGTAEAFLKLSEDIRTGKCGLSDDQLAVIQRDFRKIYEITERYGFEFAYRTVREIRQYISAAYELCDNKEAFDLKQSEDEQLLQKILPKIHGNKKEIGSLMDELEKFCTDSGWSESNKKIAQMKGRLAQVQYASFI